jgi:D-alanyl-D-alanine carboxypeptidase
VPLVPAGDDRDEVLAAALAAYGSPGVLAVVRDGDATWRGALGDAEVTGTPATVGMRFRAASITKPVMAALTLRLAGAGLVDLDQPVAPLLPTGVLRPEPPVTIRQLLAHTAGIFNVGDEGDVVADIGAIADPALREEGLAFLAAAVTDPGAVVPSPVAVAAAETHDRYGAPGDTYHYSNAGYQAAGMAIEAMTGRPLADLLRDEVAQPLGLRESRAWARSATRSSADSMPTLRRTRSPAPRAGAGHRGVGHPAGVLDQALHRPQALGQGEQLGPAHHLQRRRLPAGAA